MGKGRRFLHVDAGHAFRAHRIGPGCGIHASVAAADDDDIPADTRVLALVDGLKEVDARHNPLMPGPREHAGDMPSGGDDHRIAFPPEPLEPVRVNPAAGHETDAHVLNALQFLFQNLMRKAGAGNDLLQLAAHALVSFVDGDLMPFPGKPPCGAQACDPAADHGHFFAGRPGGTGQGHINGTAPERSDLDGFVDAAARAPFHARVGTHAAAH